jgi:hypothetical protein
MKVVIKTIQSEIYYIKLILATRGYRALLLLESSALVVEPLMGYVQICLVYTSNSQNLAAGWHGQRRKAFAFTLQCL